MRLLNLIVLIATLAAPSALARTPISHETFFLIKRPGAINGHCQPGTNMTISYFEKTAQLKDVVSGLCARYVDPNRRAYKLDRQPLIDGCNSVHWQGLRRTRRGTARIEIVDHRKRVCRDIVPAHIVVVETAPNGAVSTLYSAR